MMNSKVMDLRRQHEKQKREVPCAACRLLHRKCNLECILAPYFPPEESDKFASVRKVFGASNVIRMLQIVKEEKREDTVKSMIYEAYARIQDPVFGCTGAIIYLHKCLEDLESELKTITEQITQSQKQIHQLLEILEGTTKLSQ